MSTQYDFVDVYVADDKAMFLIVMVSGVSKDNNQPYVTAQGFGFQKIGAATGRTFGTGENRSNIPPVFGRTRTIRG